MWNGRTQGVEVRDPGLVLDDDLAVDCGLAEKAGAGIDTRCRIHCIGGRTP